MSWTEEKVAKLKELWGKGNTASQIAEIIGGISRNAVIGKAHRLNLSAKIKTRSAMSNQNFKNLSEEKKIKFRKSLLKSSFLIDFARKFDFFYKSASLRSGTAASHPFPQTPYPLQCKTFKDYTSSTARGGASRHPK